LPVEGKSRDADFDNGGADNYLCKGKVRF
jgi:hypothetical protein